MFGEFAPSSFWTDVEVEWLPPDSPAAPIRRLDVVFGEAVSELCDGADTVAVSLSGGLDSLAVLWHVLRVTPPRRVIAFVVDLLDDSGMGAAAVVRRLLADMDIVDRVEVRVVDLAACRVRPDWSPFGPRLDALPMVNATVASLATVAGAQVLLSGNGADELLAVPHYATAEVVSRHGVRGALRYAGDMARSGSGRSGEIAAIAARALPAKARSRSYWTTNWPDWCNPTVSDVLAQRWQPDALAWARTWVDTTIMEHASYGRTWARADAHDSWWPRAFIPAATGLPEASPFCHVDVATAAWQLSLADRYHPAAPSTYQRMKAQVVSLFPERVRSTLPHHKRYYSRALAEAVRTPTNADAAAAIGLLDPDALRACSCTATLMTAAAVNDWLTDTIDMGLVDI